MSRCSAVTATESHGFLRRPRPLGAEGASHDSSVRLRRQDRPVELFETGAVYTMRVAGFEAASHWFFGRIGTHVVTRRRSIEIDETNDGVMTDNRALVFHDGTEAIVEGRR